MIAIQRFYDGTTIDVDIQIMDAWNLLNTKYHSDLPPPWCERVGAFLQ